MEAHGWYREGWATTNLDQPSFSDPCKTINLDGLLFVFLTVADKFNKSQEASGHDFSRAASSPQKSQGFSPCVFLLFQECRSKRRVAPISGLYPNQNEGGPGPSLLGTGETMNLDQRVFVLFNSRWVAHP
jgi:hypothetical protein